MANRPNTAPPDWFPLAVYEQNLTKDEWLTEIGLRAGLQTADQNRHEGKTRGLNLEASSEEAFRSIFVTRESHVRVSLAEAQERDFWPIRDPTAFELLFIVENQRTRKHTEAEAWAKKLNQDGKGAIGEFFSSGVRRRLAEMERDIPKEPPVDVYMDVLGKQVLAMIDLDHDDQTLELAFKVWVAGARNVLKQKARHPVGDKEIAKWKKYGLLPAFDLVFWSRATNSRFTDAFIARLIWPDNEEDFVDLTERFRKVTRPMLSEVFDWDFVNRFWRQMELENTLDVIVARDKINGG
jgi:hypothetical protein